MFSVSLFSKLRDGVQSNHFTGENVSCEMLMFGKLCSTWSRPECCVREPPMLRGTFPRAVWKFALDAILARTRSGSNVVRRCTEVFRVAPIGGTVSEELADTEAGRQQSAAPSRPHVLEDERHPQHRNVGDVE